MNRGCLQSSSGTPLPNIFLVTPPPLPEPEPFVAHDIKSSLSLNSRSLQGLKLVMRFG